MTKLEGTSGPAVSVLMAVYNCQAYLAEAIESIRNQTLSDLELIIIDDGSTDDSWQIIKNFSAVDRRIKVIKNQRNAGKAVALNRGLLISQGAYITFLDGDDVSDPKRLAQQVNYLENHQDTGAVATAALMIDDSGNHLQIVNNDVHHDKDIQLALLDRMCLCGASLLVKRQCLEKAGLHIDEVFNISMDYELCLRLSEVTQLANLPEPLYLYRQHTGSLSYTKRFRQMYNQALALERAVYRRYGPQPTLEQFGHVGRDYLRAAVIGFASKRFEFAEEALQRAIGFNPSLINNREPVETIVSRYTPRNSPEQALDFTDSLFVDLLPYNRNLAKVKSRLLSRLHMAEVFNGVAQNDPDRVAGHLWPGIRHDPSWLLNRGVVSLAIKQALGRSLNSERPRQTS